MLTARGWIAPDIAQCLESAYCFLRTIEHRLQMVADEQTHELPRDPAELDRFARFAGFEGSQTFGDALVSTLVTVQKHYARLFEASPELTAGTSNMVFAGKADDPATVTALAGMGYGQPSQVIATVRGWHHGRYRGMRSQKARERLTEIQPRLIEAFAQTADPGLALANFDRFLADLPSGLQLFSLLRTKPGLLNLLADIMGSAPRLSRILSRRRRLFDALLDPHAFGDVPTRAEFERLLAEAISAGTDAETVLNAARVTGSEQAFLIGVRMLSGSIAAEQACVAYSDLADTLISVLHAWLEKEMARVHGPIPGGASVVVAMGKLGGREMTATSDLDLIIIYDATADALSGQFLPDGEKPITAPLYYARLTQRLVSALSAPTAEGTLYEVDLRLRPSGQKGPLATALSSFIDYQIRDAWTWEHMALTRARVISGPADLRAKVEAAIAAVLGHPRDAAKITADVLDMRERIAAGKGTEDIWDLKQVRGGLVDIEFVAQYLQLVHAAENPGVLDTNTCAALAKLSDAGYLNAGDREILTSAARLFTTLTGLVRLLTDGPFLAAGAPEGVKDRLAIAVTSPSFSALEARIVETLADVRSVVSRLFS